MKRGLISLVARMVRYNLKIIFAGRFIWFVIAAFAFYLLLAINLVFNVPGFDSSNVYGILIFPGILLVFYPTVFGIQNDADARILEILFGVPDYKYKVWLARLVIIFSLTWVLIVLFCLFGNFGLLQIPVMGMSFHLMFPVAFTGCMSFLLSTIVRSGNGTAVVMVLTGVVLFIFSDAFSRTQWNIFLNPYSIPDSMNEVVWARITDKNRLFLLIGSIVFLLAGLANLRRRERLLR